MTQQLSTNVRGFILYLKNGNEYTLDVSSGEKLEALLANSELPKFIRVKADGAIATISVSMIAELKRDVTVVTFKADW
jgi:hypothetical protein